MYRINRERVKSYILLVLIVTSIIQVGILWDYQNHGFPTNFLTAFLNSLSGAPAPDTPESASEQYFTPYRVIASDGEGSHWMLYKEDEEFDRLWNEAREYLSRILDSKPSSTLPMTQWGNLVVKKAFIFEFKDNIEIDLLKWFLNKEDVTEPTSITGMHKMIIAPWDDINENMNTVYITDGKEIYKFVMKFNSSDIKGKDYNALLTRFGESSKYDLREYGVIKEFDPARNTLPYVDPDILFKASGPRTRSYKKISWSVPDRVSNLGDMADIVLGSEKTSFERSKDIYNTILFKTTDNIYRIYYNDGLLEYKYIPGPQDGDRGDAGDAFLNAFRFINRISKNLVSGADIYLSGMEKRVGSIYEFTFDYMVDEVPVVINIGPTGKDSTPVEHAIVVKANGRGVLECRWILKEFVPGSKTEEYKVYTEELDSDVNLSQLGHVDDIVISYVVESYKAGNKGPCWVIERPEQDDLIVPMWGKEGN